SAFSDYEQKTYDSLHFKFTDIKTVDKASEGADFNVRGRSVAGRVMRALGLNRDDQTRQDMRSDFISDYIDNDGKIKTGNLIEHHAEALKCQLQSIYRRGRLSASNANLFMQSIPQVDNSGREINHVAEALNMKICQIAKNVTSESRYNDCSAGNVINMFVKTQGENIVVSNNEVLEEIFAPEGREALNQSLQTEIDDLNTRLSDLRNKISAIKGTSKYESLDKIKAFMAWDMKDRCGNDSFTNIAVTSCQSLPEQENINYLLA